MPHSTSSQRPPNLALPGETQVAVAGDWHANEAWVRRSIPAIAAVHEGIRTILHLGDFGLNNYSRGRDFCKAVDHQCKQAGIERVLVTPGNHEDWQWLDKEFAAAPGLPIQVSSAVHVLPRGYRFTLGGRSFLSFGGAASIDFAMREPGVNWFPTELPTDDEVDSAIAEGPVDVLLAHETIDGGTPAVELITSRNARGWDLEAVTYSSWSRKKMTKVWAGVEAGLLFHGHMHVQDEVTLEDGRRVYSLGSDDQPGNLGVLDLDTLAWEWLGVLPAIIGG